MTAMPIPISELSADTFVDLTQSRTCVWIEHAAKVKRGPSELVPDERFWESGFNPENK